jgi:hypothetical protein
MVFDLGWAQNGAQRPPSGECLLESRVNGNLPSENSTCPITAAGSGGHYGNIDLVEPEQKVRIDKR